MLIKKQGKLKCCFNKSWSVQIKAEKNDDLPIVKTLGKIGTGN
jgi:hypothetical protein